MAETMTLRHSVGGRVLLSRADSLGLGVECLHGPQAKLDGPNREDSRPRADIGRRKLADASAVLSAAIRSIISRQPRVVG